MQLLSSPTRALVHLLAVIAILQVLPQSSAHPPHTPDHGVNESTACTLWAGDVDVTNVTEAEDLEVNESAPEICALAELTDVPLDSPPTAVETWNAGEQDRFPATDGHRSIHPPNVSLSDGRFIADAYAEVFTVQPSTRARHTPDADERYVAANGSLLGTVDFRAELPPDDTTGNRRIYWRLNDHEVTATRLRVDGAIETNGTGSHTPELPYDLADDPGTDHSLTLEATVRVELEKRIETCGHRSRDGTCTHWDVRFEYPDETTNVSDAVDVVEYELSVSGYRARYPDGTLGLVLFKNQPWLGHSVPAGDVRGVWRFYVARDAQWDRLVTDTTDGQSVAHSPLHPLRVTAYPIETGPTASPRSTVEIIDVYGAETEPPTLPEDVELDVLQEPYTASFGLATRTATTDHGLANVTAVGLVRGVDANVTPGILDEIPIHRSNLTLTVENHTDERARVRVTLRDNETGDPIATDSRAGYVIVEGARHNTSTSGTTTVTVPRGEGSLSARYVPGDWWDASTGYVGDSDAVYVRSGVFAFLGIVFEVAIPTGLFLFAVFVIDQFTSWGIWPPWRRL